MLASGPGMDYREGVVYAVSARLCERAGAAGGGAVFCSNCGQQVGEGKAFCTSCGSPLLPAGAGPAHPPPAGPAPAPGYPAGMPPYVPPPRPGQGRGALIAGIVVAAVVILAGIGVGVYFGFFHDRDEPAVTGKPSTTLTTVANASTSTTALTGSVTTAPGSAGTTTGSSGTYQTIPSLNPTYGGATTETTGDATGETSGTTENVVNLYLAATDKVISEMEADDARIPTLATQINDAAPKVPPAVRAELQKMLDMLDTDTEELASLGVPSGFEESYRWLDQAIGHMGNRIYATIQGIDVMAQTGTVSSANGYFDEGRTERDAYRAAMTQYHNVVPID